MVASITNNKKNSRNIRTDLFIEGTVRSFPEIHAPNNSKGSILKKLVLKASKDDIIENFEEIIGTKNEYP